MVPDEQLPRFIQRLRSRLIFRCHSTCVSRLSSFLIPVRRCQKNSTEFVTKTLFRFRMLPTCWTSNPKSINTGFMWWQSYCVHLVEVLNVSHLIFEWLPKLNELLTRISDTNFTYRTVGIGLLCNKFIIPTFLSKIDTHMGSTLPNCFTWLECCANSQVNLRQSQSHHQDALQFPGSISFHSFNHPSNSFRNFNSSDLHVWWRLLWTCEHYRFQRVVPKSLGLH